MMLAKLSYILLLISFWIGSSATFVYSAELIDRIVAVVNGEIITQRQLDQGKVIIKERFGIQDMIDICILTQEAKKEGIPVNLKAIEERLSKLEKESSQGGGLKIVLKGANLTLPEYKEWLRKKSLREGLIYRKSMEINEEIVIQESEIDDFYLKLKRYLDGFSDSEKEVKEFYQIYQEELEEIGKVKIAYFIVKDKTIADKIQERLEEGGDSALLVEEISLGSESFEGEVNLRDIKPYLREAIISLKIGQVSKLEVKENGSFWVIQLKERREFLYSEYKDQIESYLKNKKGEEILQAWIKELGGKADIRII